MSRAAAAGAGRGWPGGRSPGWSAARSLTCSRCAAEVTEYQLIERHCGCGHRTKGAAPQGARGSGPVRAADRRGHHLPARRAVPIQTAHRAGAGRAVRHPVLVRDGRGADRPRGRAAGRVPGARPRPDRRQRGGRVRRDRVPGRGPLAWVHCARTGKYTLLMVHPKRGTAGDGGDGRPSLVRRGRRPRRLGAV